MKLAMWCTLFVLFNATLVFSHEKKRQSWGKDQKEVFQVINSLVDAYCQKKIEPLMALFDEDAISLWSTGEVLQSKPQHRKAYLKDFKNLKKPTVKWVPQHIKIERNMAWLVGKLSWRATYGPEDASFELNIRSTFILKKNDKRWLIVHEHSTKIQE